MYDDSDDPRIKSHSKSLRAGRGEKRAAAGGGRGIDIRNAVPHSQRIATISTPAASTMLFHA